MFPSRCPVHVIGEQTEGAEGDEHLHSISAGSGRGWVAQSMSVLELGRRCCLAPENIAGASPQAERLQLYSIEGGEKEPIAPDAGG